MDYHNRLTLSDETLQLIADFFDGLITDVSEIVRLTGLPESKAAKVYEAINQLHKWAEHRRGL